MFYGAIEVEVLFFRSFMALIRLNLGIRLKLSTAEVLITVEAIRACSNDACSRLIRLAGTLQKLVQ